MKNIFTSLLLLGGMLATAQTGNTNYVKSTTYKVATADGSTNRSNGTPIDADNKIETIQYFDGLGRPIQSIQVKAGGNKENIVQHMEYDQYGRQVKNYLPYATSGQVTVDPLDLVTDPVSGINTYYQTNYGSDFNNVDFNPYSETEFENSPLNRAFKQAAPGSDWAMGSGHEVKMDYQTNTLSDGVKVFGVDFNDINDKYEPTLIYKNNYQPGKLYKSIVKDENWTTGKDHTVEEFTDFEGRVVLKRTYNNEQPHDTYYVYDDYGNLSYVIPPLAADQIVVYTNQSSISGTLNSSWASITNVDREFAKSYNRQLSEYDNSAILNADIVNKYNGSGGLSIQNHNNGEYLSVSINFTANKPLALKTGYVQSLKALGVFEDTDIGVFSGNGYDYTLSIKKNYLYISGEGSSSAIQATVNNQTKLDYNINYPWVDFVAVDKDTKYNYLSGLKGVSNAQILSAQVNNIYNGMGGLNVTVDSQDNVSVTVNTSWNGSLSLRKGAVISLDLDRLLEDRTLGNITSKGVDYTLELKNNRITIVGDGRLSGISDNFIAGPYIRITTVDQATLEGLCYIYEYDHRNRLVEKKIPGKDWEHIVYDHLDRPILTQDGNQRTGRSWSFSKYDKLGRVTYTGLFTSSLSRKQMQQAYQTFYEIPISPFTAQESLYEVRIPESYWSSGGKDMYYTHRSFPNISSELDVLTISFYDDKVTELVDGTDFKYDLGLKDTNDLIYNEAQKFGLEPVYNNTMAHIGLTTISEIRILGTNNWMNSAAYYDEKARPVFSIGNNEYLNTTDRNWMSIDFVGKLIGSETRHQRSNPNELITLKEGFSYDHMDRLISHYQSINGQQDELIVENSYDAMGQLIDKGVGGLASSSHRLQTVNYDYNVRGWLTDINKGGLGQGDLFSFSLNYNDPTQGTALFNGNISQSHWVTAVDQEQRHYDYDYDALNRLTAADYIGANLTNSGAPGLEGVTENYSMGDVNYDKNGNITQLSRYGLYKENYDNHDYNAVDKVDVLTYTYAPKSNQLLDVKDLADNVDESILNGGFKDKFQDGNKYVYSDLNGNMTADKNKDISEITYNHLNLPVEINFTTDKKIEYVYDATGVKLQKKVYDFSIQGTPIKTTSYANNYIYEKETGVEELQFFSHPEGYVEKGEGSFDYVYQYKDHLGSVRLSYSDSNNNGSIESSTEILQERNTYPFGLEHKGYNNVVVSENNYQTYQGQELEKDLGKDTYAYQWRDYDPAIARFNKIDRFAEKYEETSPYAFVKNSPIYFREIKGDSLDVGNNSESKKDIKLLVRKGNLKYLNIDGNGKVSLNFNDLGENETKESLLAGDEGLNLINDLISSDKFFLYEASDLLLMRKKNGDKSKGELRSPSGIINSSEFGLDSDGTLSTRPRFGYHGQVVISPGVTYFEENSNGNEVVKSRGSIIFHELAENYERTHNGINYNGPKGAHQLAINRERYFHLRSNTPGEVLRIVNKRPSRATRKKYVKMMADY